MKIHEFLSIYPLRDIFFPIHCTPFYKPGYNFHGHRATLYANVIVCCHTFVISIVPLSTPAKKVTTRSRFAIAPNCCFAHPGTLLANFSSQCFFSIFLVLGEFSSAGEKFFGLLQKGDARGNVYKHSAFF